MKTTMTLALAALACWGAAAQAQTAPANTLPEALKGIPQAGLACTRESFAQEAAARIQAPPPDLRCALEVHAAQRQLEQPDDVVIDLRPAGEFAQYHIDGAVNASLADLLGKPYWRGRKVMLAGDGKGERELYAACARLKDAGYRQVAVLRGGMAAWLAAGKPVRGRAPSAQQLARLSADELWQESQFAANQVVLGQDRAALAKDLPSARPVSSLDPAAIRHAAKGAATAALVLVTGADLPDDRLQQLQRALAPQPLLVYTGTRDAYARQLATRQAMWRAHANGPKQPACGQ